MVEPDRTDADRTRGVSAVSVKPGRVAESVSVGAPASSRQDIVVEKPSPRFAGRGLGEGSIRHDLFPEAIQRRRGPLTQPSPPPRGAGEGYKPQCLAYPIGRGVEAGGAADGLGARPIRSRHSLPLLLALTLAACAGYRPAPLPAAPSLAAASDPAPAGPWTAADVVAMALRDSPDLEAVRAQRVAAEGARRQAGLLPDPALGGAILPLVAGMGTTLAWNAAIGEDLRGLVTLSARREGAKAAALQVDAQVLWQEWQTAAQAKLLFVQIVEGDRALAIQRESATLFAERNARLQAALGRGDASLASTAPDLAALQGARALVGASERQQLSRRHQLNALLGREPDAILPLAPTAAVAEPDLARIDARAAEISRRRPDLIALRLGYRAQEARVRLAVLMQFPVFNLGLAGGSDNSNVRNLGPQISTTVPLFDGNRADVALQRATRAQLRAEYQARLDAAYGQLRAAVGELRAGASALAAASADLPGARRARDQAQRALDAGAIDELTYADLAGAYYAKALEVAQLEETVLEQRLAIGAAVGEGLPAVQDLPDAAR